MLKPFSLSVRRSGLHLRLLLTVYGVTLGLLSLLELSAFQYAVALPALAVAVGLDPRWRQQEKVLRRHNQGWSWSATGEVCAVELLSWRIFAGVTFISFRFNNNGKKTTLTLFPDSASRDELKSLRRSLFVDDDILSGKI